MSIQKLNIIEKNSVSCSKKTRLYFFVNVFLLSLAFLIILAALPFAWIKLPQLLYAYRDGEYNLWISLKTAEWSSLFDLTSINPLEGMTSMLVAINPYFDPGQWIVFSDLSQSMKILISYTIYASEVMLSTFFLGIMLGFNRLHAFVASIWVILILFPPFNFFFGLAGWLVMAPIFGHALALSNLCLITCLKLGSSSQTKFKMFFKNLLLASFLVLLITAILVAAPFYNAGMLLGTAFLLICITSCSQTKEQFYWRIFAGLMIVAILYTLRLPEFYSSTKAYSARFAEYGPFFSVKSPIIITDVFNKENFTKALNMLCNYGMYCEAFPSWPISVSAIWVNLAIIGGSIIAWLTAPQPIAKIGFFVAAWWTILLFISSLMGLGILSSLIAPVWFFLMMYSLLALYSLYILALPIKLVTNYFKITFNAVQLSIFSLLIAIVTSIGIIKLMDVQPAKIVKTINKEAKTSKADFMLKSRHQLTPIIHILQQEVALQPGNHFHGLVATIYGTAKGSLRKINGVRKTNTVEQGQFEEFLTAANQSGSSHDLLDLWAWNIPTLSEYGQGLSRPLRFYMIKFLSAPGDAIESHFAFPHVANLDILRAMGVHFIIIDAPLFDSQVILRQKIKAGEHATLFLYELSKPNLGNYSPTQLLPFNNANEFYKKIRANPKLLETNAYVESPAKINLIPASYAEMTFKKGGIHVTAKSKGTSALLLPVQFSHCYQLDGPSSVNSKIMRANLIHTLLIFKGNLDINLVWRFRWRQSKCRQQDVAEMKSIIL